MRDINQKYKINYTYVRLSSDIHSGSGIIHSGSDIQYLLIQYPFGYFATSVRISVRVFRIGCHFGYRVKCPPLTTNITFDLLIADRVLNQSNVVIETGEVATPTQSKEVSFHAPIVAMVSSRRLYRKTFSASNSKPSKYFNVYMALLEPVYITNT